MIKYLSNFITKQKKNIIKIFPLFLEIFVHIDRQFLFSNISLYTFPIWLWKTKLYKYYYLKKYFIYDTCVFNIFLLMAYSHKFLIFLYYRGSQSIRFVQYFGHGNGSFIYFIIRKIYIFIFCSRCLLS